MNATQQKFKPILFSTEMVQAILAGRKTQTRRVCSHQFWQHSELTDFNINKIHSKVDRNVSSKYQPGDILWVRETFTDEPYGTFYPKNGFFYKADDELPKPRGDRFDPVWKPSIHMPKEAARIFLKVTNVRVERLQEISEEDAISEGVVQSYVGHPNNFENTKMRVYRASLNDDGHVKSTDAFRELWQSINAKKHPWESNPWVWVYEFERIEKPENFN